MTLGDAAGSKPIFTGVFDRFAAAQFKNQLFHLYLHGPCCAGSEQLRALQELLSFGCSSGSHRMPSFSWSFEKHHSEASGSESLSFTAPTTEGSLRWQRARGHFIKGIL